MLCLRGALTSDINVWVHVQALILQVHVLLIFHFKFVRLTHLYLLFMYGSFITLYRLHQRWVLALCLTSPTSFSLLEVLLFYSSQ